MDDSRSDHSHASIPGEVHDVANASRRDLLRAALFDTPPVDRRVGRFPVRGVLGRGGMGTVLEAYDEVLDRPVAIKLLHPTLARHEARLLEEARALAQLSHPNVVQVYEAGKADENIYIVMELVRGRTLRDWQRERPAWRACVQAYVQAGQGLAAAHARGLVHRDFKPSNCIRDAQGRVRVLDFGLVQRVVGLQASDSDVIPLVGIDEATQPATPRGSRVGTPAYMAPELLLDGPADAKSDQYAFCVALFEALIGRHPFGQGGPDTLHDAMQRGGLVLTNADPGVPAWIRRALARGLRVDPAARWPSMDALLRALDPSRRTGRRAWQTAVVAGLVGAGGLYAWVARPRLPCRGDAPQLDAVWDDARREAVGEGLVASGSPLAEDTWARLEPQVDAYLQRWSGAHRGVCEATHVRGEQSEALMDQRMACLDLRLDAVASFLRVLEHADADTVLHAMDASLRLPEPEPCRTHAERDEPPDPEGLRPRLVALVTEIELGRTSPRAELEALQQDAKAAGLDRVAASAQYWRGVVEYRHGDIAVADTTLEAAIWEALAVGDDETALRAMLEHLDLVGVVLVDPARALPRVEQSQAFLRRVGEPPGLRVRWLVVTGNTLARNGRFDDARARIEEALISAQALLDPRQPYEDALNAAGMLAQLEGRPQEAARTFERLLEHARATYGERHPAVAAMLNNLAVAEANAGDFERARERLVEALAIRREVLGARHPAVADSSMNLAGASVAERPAEAFELVEEARAIYVATLGATATKTVAADLARGRVLAQLQRSDEAEQIYRDVLARQRHALGPAHPGLVPTAKALRMLLEASGRTEEAAEMQALADRIEHGPPPESSGEPL